MAKGKLTLPACLVIMDGFGLAQPGPGNAISLADTPCLDALFATLPWTKLAASGLAVGLPEGQMGNSEVGHLNIGAGRVVHQELTRINRACDDGTLSTNVAILRACSVASKPKAVLHLMGLLSDGGVHSSQEHLFALIRTAKEAGVKRVFVHVITDGRDVPPRSAEVYIAQLEEVFKENNDERFNAQLGSVSGRYFAMDRDNRWDRVRCAFDAIVCASPYTSLSASQIIRQSYEDGINDEFVEPCSLNHRGVKDQDALIFFNFRPDRARQITRAMTEETFKGFKRARRPLFHVVCLSEYDPTISAPVAFPKEIPDDVLADVLSVAGLRQYHLAETEKYAHVTFFLNGGREAPKEGEIRVLIDSPKVATYDLMPQMCEPQVASTLCQAIKNDEADVYVVNFANPDMVGHTGVIPAAIKAIEAVDKGLKLVLQALELKGGVALITADHGNADKMLADDGTPFTAHTTAPVPLILADFARTGYRLEARSGALCDIAPTLLQLIGLQKPDLMTGNCLLV